MPRFIKMWLFSALISFTALGMWKGIEWYYSRDIEETAPIVVTATDLANAYDVSEGNASATYDGKYVVITGVITNMGSASNYYTVNLESNIYIEIDLIIESQTEIAKLASVGIGDTITVKGKVIGLNVVYIQINDCEIE